jgi:hypothetical protein
MLPEMNEKNDIGDDTVIGGINSQLQSTETVEETESSNK